MLPQISDTERQALEAGTSGSTASSSAATPTSRRCWREPYNTLPPEEQAFLDGPAEELCKMIDRYTISRTRRVPEHVLDYMKKQGFYGPADPEGIRRHGLLGAAAQPGDGQAVAGVDRPSAPTS